jgi:hypothetical protein
MHTQVGRARLPALLDVGVLWEAPPTSLLFCKFTPCCPPYSAPSSLTSSCHCVKQQWSGVSCDACTLGVALLAQWGKGSQLPCCHTTQLFSCCCPVAARSQVPLSSGSLVARCRGDCSKIFGCEGYAGGVGLCCCLTYVLGRGVSPKAQSMGIRHACTAGPGDCSMCTRCLGAI